MSSSGEESEEDLDHDVFHTEDLSAGALAAAAAEEEKAAAAEKEEEWNGDDDPIFLQRILRDRLHRRTHLLSEMRKAYLRDIVSLKSFLHEFLTSEERTEVYEQWKDSLPTLDLRQHLMLYSPHETSLNLLPCEACGGSVEILHHESSEIQALSKALSHTDKTKHGLKVVIGTKTAQLEALERKWELETRKHRDEVSEERGEGRGVEGWWRRMAARDVSRPQELTMFDRKKCCVVRSKRRSSDWKSCGWSVRRTAVYSRRRRLRIMNSCEPPRRLWRQERGCGIPSLS